MTTNKILLFACVLGALSSINCDGGSDTVPEVASTDLVPFGAYDLAPGEGLTLATWTAPDQQIAHVEVIGANVETTAVGNANLSVGVQYTGPVADPNVDDPHSTTVWPVSYQPMDGQTRLLGGLYSVVVGCDGTAVHHCLFGFRAWVEGGAR